MYQNQEYKSRFRILKGGLISLVVASNLYGVPSGGVVTSGTANISQNGNTTNINQSTNKASINWQDFSIKNGETVNFNQPNQNSITLNRVVGNEKSIIDGALNANGQVWLLNSNGTLFGKNAKVNTSGLLVTTKNLKDQDFQNGNYNFKGDSKNSIENLGYIDSKKYASFIANSVINSGEIKVHSGTVNLIGASEFSVNLDDNSNISLKVNKGVLDALVENNNLIIANSGNVYLTTNAKNELLKGVVNNSGIIEANSLDHITGEVILFAHGGTANIDGEIKAKNSFVETSGDKVKIKDGFKVSADKWLIDPTDFTIAVSGGDISGTTLSNNLSSANVEIESTKGAKVGKGDIYVNDTISWSTNKTLTLNAQNDIFINKSITANHNNGKLALKYGQASTTGGSSDYYVNAKVNLKAGGNFSTQRGNTGTIKNYIVITNLNLGNQGSITVTDLQGINGNLNNPNANYVLGSDINASATSSWNVGYGFNPIGNNLNKFAGTFDGLGHTISNLYINGTDLDFVGLFGVTNTNAVIKNIGLKDVNITGQTAVGGLVGINGGTISNSYATGTVNGNWSVGGLVGINGGTISNSYATGTVSWLGNNVGGLVGFNNGIITNSYATNSVTGSSNVGGLVGNNNGTITNSWYDKDTNQDNMSDSATYGKTKAEILEALKGKDGWITGVAEVEGYGKDSVELPQLKTFYKPTNTLFEGGFGTAENPYTITNWTQLQNINNSNILTKGYYLSLINNLSSSTSDYTNFASSTANSNQGFNPIGNVSYRFNGTFDGLGHNISDLYINRPTKHYVGLFGYINTNTVIKNIGLKDVNITGTIYVGGLVGSNTGTISNSYITGLVSGIDTVGGLVGINNEGTITNSYATGTVNGIDYVVGGLVGDNRGTITNSYATVSVTGTEYVGGLAGYNYKGTIENSYASGTVTGSGYVGGLAGDNSRTISSSFYDNTKYAGAGVGGGYQTGVTGLTTAQMSYGGSFSAWDIIADSSVTSLTPILKYDSVNDKYVWAIAPLVVNYNLGSKSTTYNGLTQNLSSFYNSSIFGTNYNFISTTDYKFQVNGTDVTGYKNAGTYSNIKVASTNEFLNIANSGNINIDGTLTINKKAATVTANSDSKVYNGQIQSVNGFTVDGLVNNEQSSVLVGLENLTTSGTNAGTYNTNLGLGTYVGNYNLTFEQGKLVIAKADATVTVNSDLNKVYNGQTQSVNGFTVDGLVNNEQSSVLVGLENLTTSGTNAGTYNTNLGLGTYVGNYNLTFEQGKLVIAKADATVTANSDLNKVYNGQIQSVNGFTVDGLVGNDTKSDLVGFTGDSANGKDVGTYNTNLGLGTYVGNYNLTFEQGKLVIAKADATVTANSDLNKVYNGQIQSVNGFTVDGLVGNDTKSDLVGFTGDSANGKDVGTYNTNLGLGTYVGNYNLTFEQGKLTIAPKDISVVADNKSKIQGDGNPDLTYDVVGLIGNDTLNGSLETNALKDSLAGDYDITKGSLENSNYNIKDFTNGTLSVLAKVVPTPEPESTPQIQAIIDGNERSVNQTQNKSSVDTKHNVNILSLNTIKDTKIVNGGIRMPENIVTKEEDIIK